jgi:TolB-like protein
LAYNALGVYLTLAGKGSEARGAFEQALMADNTSYEALANLGYLSWQAGDLRSAQRSFQEAHRIRADDELSRIFLEKITTKELEDAPGIVGSQVLIVPFAIMGGSLRRLGEGEALAEEVARRLPSPVSRQVATRKMLLARRQRESLDKTAAWLALAKEKGVAYVVFGELQSFSAKLVVHGQVGEVKTQIVKRISPIHEIPRERLGVAAQDLAEQVANVIAQEPH